MSSTRPKFDLLRDEAREVAQRAFVPYSDTPSGVICLLSDGHWVPGVRVENASFPLVLPALLNAFTTCVALERPDVVAVAKSGPFTSLERSYLVGLFDTLSFRAQDCCMIEGGSDGLPNPISQLSLDGTAASIGTPLQGIRLARSFAKRAHAPLSNFPVGCAVQSTAGDVVPGCNVEHPDWLLTLCAERNALGTALSYGLVPEHLYLSCPNDSSATPCGACRQVMTEISAAMPIWMDRGDTPPERATAAELLPRYFDGRSLRRHARPV